MSSMIKSLFKKPEKLPEFTEYKLQMSPAVFHCVLSDASLIVCEIMLPLCEWDRTVVGDCRVLLRKLYAARLD